MKRIHDVFILSSLLALILSGCWTVHESEFPQVEMTKTAKEIRVIISGFEASVTSYTPVYTYETSWRPRYLYHYRYGYCRYSPSVVPETYSSTTYVPQTSRISTFVERARGHLEDAGFLVALTNASYRVDVKFSGPTITTGDRTATFMWMICSALSADYAAQTWGADLRIYEVATNKMIFHSAYEQKYSVAVWGPLPLLSPAGADEISSSYGQSWCLTALTDRALADATSFLSNLAK